MIRTLTLLAPLALIAAAPTPTPDSPEARVAALNAAKFEALPATTAKGSTPPKPTPALVKAEVLLARAYASPGEIDGLGGTNLHHALAAYAGVKGLPADGALTADIWNKLTQALGQRPVATLYTVTQQDADGPYYPDVGEDLYKASKLKRVGYSSAKEALAERFHMSEGLLDALNPGAEVGKAGTVLVVADVGPMTLPKVDHIEVDKAHAALRAYDADNHLLAQFPATVGSRERPSPSGTHKVKSVTKDPFYTYDPKKLTWGPRQHGKFTVPPGPRNPVGAVWIALDAPDYGLHGTPDPHTIGKTGSHGCVRLTNWDALELADGVAKGVTVVFLNERH